MHHVSGMPARCHPAAVEERNRMDEMLQAGGPAKRNDRMPGIGKEEGEPWRSRCNSV